MIRKNSVVKIQNLIVNHKSRPVKSNSVSLDANQIKYGVVEVANFITNHWNHGYKIIISKCIQHVQSKILHAMLTFLGPFNFIKYWDLGDNLKNFSCKQSNSHFRRCSAREVIGIFRALVRCFLEVEYAFFG